jgi:hypothetical protein
MANSESDTKITIEKFSGENYHLWKFKMMMVLKEKGLWEFVEGKELDPAASEKERNDFKRREERALALLVLSLSDAQLLHVQPALTAKEAWLKLSEVHERKGLANKLYLRRKFLTVKMEEGDGMQAHINKVKTMAQQLTAIGAPVADEDIIVTLLYSLPENYESLIVALESRADALTLEFITARLLHEEARRKEAGVHQENISKAFLSQDANSKKGKEPGKAGKGGKKKSGNCFYCGKAGHFKNECRKRISEEKKAPQANSSSTKQKEGRKEGEKEFLFLAHALTTTTTQTPKDTSWIVDSGASQHMTHRKDWLACFEEIAPVEIHLADNSIVEAVGKGQVKLDAARSLGSVWYVPKLAKNLFSVRKAVSNGAKIEFGSQDCGIKSPDGQISIQAQLKDGLYQFLVPEQVYCASTTTLDLWHRRMGHLNEQSIRILEKGLAKGLEVSGSTGAKVCESCAVSKITRRPFPKGEAVRAAQLLGVVHSDVCGPMRTPTLGGGRYFVTFIDDKSRTVFVYILTKKSEVLAKFKEFEAYVTNLTGFSIKILQSDNGGEYIGTEYKKFCAGKGIKQQMSAPNTPEQNGIAERWNRTLVEMARCMLHHSGLDYAFWGEAIMTAAYLRNRSPTAALGGKMTPWEVFTSQKPDLSHLRTFGCVAYAHIPQQQRHKLEQKALKCIMVGYSTESKAYRLWNPANKRIFVSRDVIFDEDKVWKDWNPAEEPEKHSETIQLPIGGEPSFLEPQEVQEGLGPNEGQLDAQEELPGLVEDSDDDGDFQDAEQSPARPKRTRKPPGEWWKINSRLTAKSAFYALAGNAADSVGEEPLSLKEAQQRSDAEHWKKAVQVEYDALIKNNTWDLVPLPAGRKTVGSKWVFKLKLKPDGSIERYKARLVAKGYSQVEGLDYSETFAPVAKFPSIRTVLAIAASEDMEIHQMDVKTAFLNGFVEEEIYMAQPEGFVKPGEENLVCKLRKTIYGLKQAPRAWNKVIDDFLKSLGFQRCAADHCIYVISSKEGILYLVIYVDDLILASKSLELLEAVKQELKRRFQMADMGELEYFLGVVMTRNRLKRRISLSQKHYSLQILKRFNMQDCKAVGTPMEPGQKLIKSQEPQTREELLEMAVIPYRNAVGSLIYVMLGTRPDLAAAVGSVSQFMANPGKQHWQAVKRILRYLKGTADMEICLGSARSKWELVGYSDADWGSNLDDRRSVTGFVFLLNGPISWQSKKQPTVALSSTEAEYMALSQATKEAMWLRSLLGELGYAQGHPTRLLGDNQGSLALSSNPVQHSRSKHIDIRHHFIREAIEDEKIMLEYCNTRDMIADILTKPLTRQQFSKLRSLMGVNAQTGDSLSGSVGIQDAAVGQFTPV